MVQRVRKGLSKLRVLKLRLPIAPAEASAKVGKLVSLIIDIADNSHDNTRNFRTVVFRLKGKSRGSEIINHNKKVS